MKITEIARPGLVVVGVVGLTATALVGFAAGVMAARDPEGTRRVVRRAVREAGRGLEQATRFAAQAREQFGDLWAEARAEVDEAAAVEPAGQESPAAPVRARQRGSKRATEAAAAETDTSPGVDALEEVDAAAEVAATDKA